MASRYAENMAVLKALGLDHLKRVTAVNIRLRVNSLPVVVIWQHLDELGRDEPAPQRFHLVPVDEVEYSEIVQPAPIPFNLDGACAAAMDSLRLGIEAYANHQLWEWRQSCYERNFRAEIAKQIEQRLVPLFRANKFVEFM